jgi:transposase
MLQLSYERLIDILPYFGIKNVPHFTTLIRFAKRVPLALLDMLLSSSAKAEECFIGAIDATGLSRSNASSYYVKRIDRNTKTQKHAKLSLYVDIGKRKILSARLRAKPRHDTLDVKPLLDKSPIIAENNLMDKGYDDNDIHALFRDKGKCSIIPARKGCKRGQYRKEMRDFFDYGQYWQRNIIESVHSAVKRKFGSVLSCRNIRTQRVETYARLILHNISLAIARLFHGSLTIQNLFI